MESVDARKRLRLIRAAAYRCQHRDERGILCGFPACDLDDLDRVVCREHGR